MRKNTHEDNDTHNKRNIKKKKNSFYCRLHALILHTAQYARIKGENWSLCSSEQAHNTYSCFLNIVYAQKGLMRHQDRILYLQSDNR